VLGNADQVLQLAARLDRDAHEFEDAGLALVRRLESASWQCGRASRFRNEMRSCADDARRRADSIRAIAVDLRRHAQWIRDEQARLSSIERRVRSWIDDIARKGVRPPWEDWGIHLQLPRSLDPAWDSLANDLRRRGIGI
jgi:hypothetical protein